MESENHGADEIKIDATKSLENVLGELNDGQFHIIKEAMCDNQKVVETLSQKLQEQQSDASSLREAMGLLSDYLSSMIHSRISLEKNSNSEIALKRKQDFQAMKEKGIFSKDYSDVDAIRQMITFCQECFEDAPESEKALAKKVSSMFCEKFPQLSGKLNHSVSALQTVDAAFDLLSNQFHQEKIQKVVNSQRDIMAKLHAFDVVQEQEAKMNVAQDKYINASAGKIGELNKKAAMNFEAFAKKTGLFGQDEEDYKPPKKKAKYNKNEQRNLSISEEEHFMKYAIEQERKVQEAQARFKDYYQQYMKKKETEKENRLKILERIDQALPALLTVADHIKTSSADKSIKDTEKNTNTLENPQVDKLQAHSNKGVEKTIDASKTDVFVDDLLFDL